CPAPSAPTIGATPDTGGGERCPRSGENLLIKLHPCNSDRSQLTLRARRSSRGDPGRMRLSYSAISTYETCPAKYKFQYEDRLPTEGSPALTFGDSLHRVLHRFHDRPVPAAPTLPEMHEMLEGEWRTDGYRDDGEERLYRHHAWQDL